MLLLTKNDKSLTILGYTEYSLYSTSLFNLKLFFRESKLNSNKYKSIEILNSFAKMGLICPKIPIVAPEINLISAVL